MKTLFRSSFIFLISFVAPCLAPMAQAQYNLTTLISGGTNVIPAQSSNVFTSLATITGVRGRYVTLQATFSPNTAPTTGSNIFLKFDNSIDAAKFQTNAFLWVITPVASVTYEQTYITNLDIGSLGYLRMSQVLNSNSVVITNFTFKYSQKPGL